MYATLVTIFKNEANRIIIKHLIILHTPQRYNKNVENQHPTVEIFHTITWKIKR